MTQALTLLEHITYNPQQCGGRPCIRGMRIRVSDVLEMLGVGVSEAEILQDFPDLEREDIWACLRFAAQRVDFPRAPLSREEYLALLRKAPRTLPENPLDRFSEE